MTSLRGGPSPPAPAPPPPLAVCVLVRRGDRYLFVERARGRFAAGYWTPVTGRLEAGESFSEAARREVFEETGLQVEVGRELGRTGTDAPPGKESPGFELVWLEATSRGGDVKRQESEIAQARWVTLGEALALSPMFPTTRSFLRSLSSS